MPTATAVQFASAVSDHDQTTDALNDALDRLTTSLQGSVDAAFVFATPHHRDSFDVIQKRIAAALSPRVCLGATAGGVIGVRRETENSAGLSILAARLPGATLTPFHTESLGRHDDADQLRALIAPRCKGEDAGAAPSAILMLADPFSTPLTGMLPALADALPESPVIGGMASGARNPGGNRLILNDHVHDQGGVGVALGGEVRVDITVSQGCRAIGKPWVITKAKRNVLMELGGRNALVVAREMLEGLSDEDRHLLQSNGWLIGRVINEYKERFGRGDFLIRQVLGVDPNAGYFAIGDAQVRVGQTIQFHLRDQKTAREDFSLLLEAQKLHGNHGGALLFSCNGRGTHLFSQPNADATMVHDALGDIPLAGCFAAGEIGPVGRENHLHGHTASLAVIRGA